MNERIPIYEREPYRRTRATHVVAVGEADGKPWAELSETIFYPEGGGQPADQGRVGDAEVLDVQTVDGVVRHALSRSVAIGPVELELDWARRYDHMQQHTAQHVLTAIAADRFGWPTTSFHLGPELCDIELDVATLGTDDLERLEDAVAEEIRWDRAILARRFDPERVDWQEVRTRGLPPGHRGSVRLVDINGLDLAACGGTHLRSTGEIGALTLLGTESLRGGTRLSWVAGDRVRRRLRAHEGRNAELRRVLGTGDDELVAVAGSKIDQAKEAGRRLRATAERWADARAEALASRPGRVLAEHEDGVDAGTLGRL
ncbi:MAG: alanyl-tRNA editing protein, partial [Acidobacteriota bacterium]